MREEREKKSIRKYNVYKLDGRKCTSHFLPAVWRLLFSSKLQNISENLIWSDSLSSIVSLYIKERGKKSPQTLYYLSYFQEVLFFSFSNLIYNRGIHWKECLIISTLHRDISWNPSFSNDRFPMQQVIIVQFWITEPSLELIYRLLAITWKNRSDHSTKTPHKYVHPQLATVLFPWTAWWENDFINQSALLNTSFLPPYTFLVVKSRQKHFKWCGAWW